MGQVIEFKQVRSRSRQDKPASAPTVAAWPLPPAAYAQQVLEPSWALWRSLVASYAGFWLAPFGIEVKVGEPPPRRGPKARATSSK